MNTRGTCYNCHRALSSCMCEYITPIKTNTQFIILMHPKEYRKNKNGTGFFTHRSLPNSKLFVGIDFTNHSEINAIINNPNNNCFVLYPDMNSINLNTTNIKQPAKQTVIFLIDGTWPCARSMLQKSRNLQKLSTLSFTHNKTSNYKFKTQPKEYCLSTIESTAIVIELLNNHAIETIEKENLEKFLLPFEKMVEYQLSCVENDSIKNPRFLLRDSAT